MNSIILPLNTILTKEKFGLIKCSSELVHDSKKKQLRVLMGNFDDALNGSILDLIQLMIKNKYELNFFRSDYGPEIMDLAERELIDIFILVINNIDHWAFNALEDRLEASLKLITQIKAIYEKPVIALCGWRKDTSVIDRAKQYADFFFLMPFEFDVLKDAIEKCLDKIKNG